MLKVYKWTYINLNRLDDDKFNKNRLENTFLHLLIQPLPGLNMLEIRDKPR